MTTILCSIPGGLILDASQQLSLNGPTDNAFTTGPSAPGISYQNGGIGYGTTSFGNSQPIAIAWNAWLNSHKDSPLLTSGAIIISVP